MPRAYWKGYLRLSLVTCAVELFPAISQSEKTRFHQINRKTGNRLRQQMVDAETGDVVDKEDKGRGYELGKGRYVPIDEDELKAVQIESTKTVEIGSFVPRDEIDRRYLDRPYYIAPADKAGVEAFAVIRDAMKDEKRVALATIVLANREHMMILEPSDSGLIGTTLRFDYEVRDEADYFRGIPHPKLPKDMLQIAKHILASKAGHFHPSQFKDRYEDALRKLVERKASGKKIEIPKSAKPSGATDLMEALRASIKGGGGKRGRAATPRRQSASKRSAGRHLPKRAPGRRRGAA